MPNTTTNFFSSSSKKDKYLSLRGRIYYSRERWHPEYVNIPTIEAKDYCNLAGESTASLFSVKITMTGWHTILWKGDIVVMRLGKKNPSAMVNMGSNDANLADFLVHKAYEPYLIM
ncbi:hypothetical protein BDQ17DRAFT_1337366 [Cyathus striatus]|nr:hypothetical protein BDQ17DRAFT_1337366 [Cyathus striatus]